MSLTRLPGFTLDTSSNVTFANANVTGNLTSGNANLGNAVTANFFIGNGSQLTGLAASYSNTNVASYLPTYTGNISANYFIGNGSTLTNITGGNVSGQVSNALISSTVYTNAQPNITSVGTLTGLTVTGNSTIDNVNLTGNIIPDVSNTYSLGTAQLNFKDIYVGPGSLYVNGKKVLEEVSGTINFTTDINQNLKITTSGSGDIQFDPIGTGVIAIKGPLQIEAGINITSSDGNAIHLANPLSVDSITTHLANTDLALSANGTGTIRLNDDVTVSGNLTVSGTTTYINTETVQLYDNIIDLNSNFTTGSPTENAGVRVLRGDDAAVLVRWNETTDKWQYTTDGSVYVDIVGTTSLGVTNLGNSATANYFTGNGSLLTSITGANVTGYVPTATVANTSATVTTAAQPNITSVGTLTSLAVTGNVTGGNANLGNAVTANFFIGNGSALSALTFGNITTFNTAGLTVDELYLQATTRLNVTASGSAGYLFDQYGATVNPAIYVTSGQTLAFNLNVATHPFLIQTSASANYSVGLEHVDTAGTVLTTTSAQGQVAGTLYWKIPYGITGNYKYQCSAHGGMNGNIVITDANVSNITVGLATYATTANAVAGANVSGQVGNALVAGTVYTNAQPNITSVGTLTSLAVTGNISAGNVKTDNLLYANGVAYSLGSGATVAGANTQIQFNDSGSFGGDANLTFNKTTATLTANYVTGTLTTVAQPNITSVGTLSSLTVGNATANTVFGNGTITSNGNISFTGASVSLGSVSNLNITGGAANYFLKTDGAGSLSWAVPSGGAGGTSLTYTANTAPLASGNVLGDQWFNTATNVLYEYINDGTSSYWVDTSSPSTSTNSAIAGTITIQDEGSNITTAVTSIDFVGGGVTATNTGNAVTVTVPTGTTRAQSMTMGIIFGG